MHRIPKKNKKKLQPGTLAWLSTPIACLLGASCSYETRLRGKHADFLSASRENPSRKGLGCYNLSTISLRTCSLIFNYSTNNI